MDPTTLAATAIGFIAGEIASGGLKEIGKEVYQAVKGVFKPEEFTFLQLLEKYPENPDIQTETAGKLEENLAENPGTAAKLHDLLKQVSDLQIKQNTITQTGDGNIAVQDITSSDIKINR